MTIPADASAVEQERPVSPQLLARAKRVIAEHPGLLNNALVRYMKCRKLDAIDALKQARAEAGGD